MKISNGLSEITTYSTNNINNAKKSYLWPEYANGKVDKINAVKRKLQSDNTYYSKASETEKTALINKAKQDDNTIYALSGKLKNTSPSNIKPGSLFNAYA